MNYITNAKKQEKEVLLLKVVRWAQRKKKKIEDLTQVNIREAVKCK